MKNGKTKHSRKGENREWEEWASVTEANNSLLRRDISISEQKKNGQGRIQTDRITGREGGETKLKKKVLFFFFFYVVLF